ncbi:MAG: TIGR02452 family protein, partial [Acidobacteriota bacterium]
QPQAPSTRAPWPKWAAMSRMRPQRRRRAPAPNAGAIARNAPDDARHIAETLRRRWGRILDIAAHFGHGALVLGAWGCGAFRNDPTVVAEAARAAIAGAAAPPRHLVFAIPNRGKIGRANFAAFHAVFQDAAAPDASA